MIAIIDYKIGNVSSVQNALDVLGIANQLTNNISRIEKADAIILPGVGAAQTGMMNLKQRKLDSVLREEIRKGKPFLGICLGMQLLFTKSEEGNTKCLSIIEGKVKKFKTKLKIPQIGWNQVKIKENILFKNIPDKSYFYFVHSYYCEPENKNYSIATTEYGENFCSVIQKDNIFATQFHPEKSSDMGLQLLKNFAEIVQKGAL